MKTIVKFLAFLMSANFLAHIIIYVVYQLDISYICRSFSNWSLPILVTFIICAIVNGYIDRVEQDTDIYDLSDMD